jgi:anti-sigma regulatory factor (Ser/Thr protein kinase)
MTKAMQTLKVRCGIGEWSDTHYAIRKFKMMAKELSLDHVAANKAEIIIAEIATNILRHADRGILSVCLKKTKNRVILFLLAKDKGPGVDSIQKIAEKGFSTKGSLGLGISILHEYADRLRMCNLPHGGFFMAGTFQLLNQASSSTCNKCTTTPNRKKSHEVPSPKNSLASLGLDLGTASQAYNNVKVSGDLIYIQDYQPTILVALFDALGHGYSAHKIAIAFREVILNTTPPLPYKQSIQSYLHSLDSSFDYQRSGAVGLLFLIDRKHAYFASRGNIQANIFGKNKWVSHIHPGVLGDLGLASSLSQIQLGTKDVFVMHTDGVKALDNDYFKQLGHYSAAQITANKIIQTKGLGKDDATVVLMKDDYEHLM